MAAYYNEIDRHAAQWLRELIKEKLIAQGEVDERSVEDVRPSDLRGFKQVHLFAGIGVWSHALRSSGWPDDYPVWTVSCPCQPFSAAGKRRGFADDRHLWPSAGWLIKQCNPEFIFGEQVSSKDGLTWFDALCLDLEGSGYAIGQIDTCAAGVGAPHIRQRLYFFGTKSTPFIVADSDGRDPSPEGLQRGREHGFIQTDNSSSIWMADSDRKRGRGGKSRSQDAGDARESVQVSPDPSPTNGFWSGAQWLACKDGNLRPTKPGLFPLVNGLAGRVALLRGAGNAICSPQAQAFITSAIEIFKETY